MSNPTTTVSHAITPWQLVVEASLVVQTVLVLLVIMSVVCWYIIGVKWRRFARSGTDSSHFLDLFWNVPSGIGWDVRRMERIYSQLGQVSASPLARVFHAGYVELARIAQELTQGNKRPSFPPVTSERPMQSGDIDNVERALRRATLAETTRLENLLPFLATTGSTAPFVGLFGTVWGIMNSLIAIQSRGAASLDVVLPSIAEALIPTAIGLVAAIPAVMAYNFFLRRVRVLESEMDAFASDYLNVVRRHFLATT